MTRPGITPAELRAAQQRRRNHAAFWILVAGSYLFISIVVGVFALANQLLKGTP